MRAERIAITGIGMVSSLGPGARASFARLVAGESGIGPLRSFAVPGARSRLAAEVAEAAGDGDARALRALSRTDALALRAAREALAEAGLGGRTGELGLAVGGTTGGMFDTEVAFVGLPTDAAPATRAARLLTHPLSTSVRVLEDALGGFRATATLCSACSSGALAVVEGARWIAGGQATAALVGGADALCRMTFAGFDALGVMSSDPCRPFDVERSGLSLGEGAAFLVLEGESHARARGARLLGWLVGYAAGAEAHHVTQPEPDGARAGELMAEALACAALDASAVDYVNAHGTGTPANDAMEARALLRLFGGKGPLVSSSKGQIGHTLGAAGALEAVIAVLALEAGTAPPSAGLEQPELPELRYVLGRGASADLRVALSNSFGFGGMNAVLVFERADAARRAPAPGARGRAPRSPAPGAAVVVTAVAGLGGGGRVVTEARGVLGGALEQRAGEGDPLADLDPARSRRFDRATAWLTRGAELALAAAGSPPGRVGLCAGSAYGAVERSVRFLERLLDPGARGARAVSPAEFPHLVQSASAANASLYLGLRGPVASVSDGATGAEAALVRALGWLELGLCEAAVAGAVEAHDPLVATLGALELAERSVARDEGGGMLVLEPASLARARGRRALARIGWHVEERQPRLDAASLWRAPRDPGRAEVVIAPSHASLFAALQSSPWAALPRRLVPASAGYHEAIGGMALAIGALLAAEHASEVLVLTGGEGARYLTLFEPAGDEA